MTRGICDQRVSVRLSDLVAILLVTLAVSVYFYHPYYFGDELFSFNFGASTGNTLLGVSDGLNSYKPRMVINLLWGVIVSQDLPRWVTMLVNFTALAVCAGLVYWIAVVHFAAGRVAALLAAAMMVLSRFNVMLYFDYVSGTVEALSLVFLLAGLAISMPSLVFMQRQRVGVQLVSLLFFIFSVFCHERYALAMIGFAGVAAIRWWAARSRVGMGNLVFACAVAIVPLALHVVAVRIFSENSIAMGTSGQTVSVSQETFKVAGTYIVNMFLGGNHGPQYFVGRFNHDAQYYLYAFMPLAVISLSAWCLPWLRPQWRKTANVLPMFSFLAAILGMIAIASLPGASRQEARWMYPTMALLLLFVFAGYKARAQLVILGVLAVTQGFYLLFGSMWSVANITAARLAVSISDSLTTMRQGGNGVVVVGPEPDISWVLGGDGKSYCRLNLLEGQCLYPRGEFAKGNLKDFSYGVVIGEPNLRGGPGFNVISADQAKRLLDPGSAPMNTVALSQGDQWPDWVGIPSSQLSAQGLELRGLSEITTRRDVSEVDRHIVVYTARSADGTPGKMRLQVNWHDQSGQFISTQIEVVDVGVDAAEYRLLAVAPGGAAHAYVYATLPDNTSGKVLLEGVGLAGP